MAACVVRAERDQISTKEGGGFRLGSPLGCVVRAGRRGQAGARLALGPMATLNRRPGQRLGNQGQASKPNTRLAIGPMVS